MGYTRGNPADDRLCISVFGRRNAGKSSLINAITGQKLSRISDIPGTTTDPVYKTMDLPPVGPVVLTDTPGLDDNGELGILRIEKTYEVMRRTDLAVVVVSAVDGLTQFERDFIAELHRRQIPSVLIVNKIDLRPVSAQELMRVGRESGVPVAVCSSQTGQGIDKVRALIVRNAHFEQSGSLTSDLVAPGELAVLVTSLDREAPGRRLILPPQPVIRDLLDGDAVALVTREFELRQTLSMLSARPALVLSDSAVLPKTVEDTPDDIPLTSFSILAARQKGDLSVMARGVRAVETLKSGGRVLIVEGSARHARSDGIVRVKLPRWIRRLAGGNVLFEWVHGTYYPRNIEKYDVIVHCGGCMLNRREMQFRIAYASDHGVAVTNYGLLAAAEQGVLRRALSPFPDAAKAYDEAAGAASSTDGSGENADA